MAEDTNIGAVMGLILKEAEVRKTNAAYGGEWGDGGASVLEDQVRFYRYGMKGVTPPEWKKYVNQAAKEADPEYAEFRRLQRKFDE